VLKLLRGGDAANRRGILIVHFALNQPMAILVVHSVGAIVGQSFFAGLYIVLDISSREKTYSRVSTSSGLPVKRSIIRPSELFPDLNTLLFVPGW